MAGVTYERVGKIYPDGTQAVSDLSLVVEDGEFMVLVGPSGCGKSTTLRMAAGLEDVTEGAISIGDDVVNGWPPQDRDVAMVFQSHALYPHMTVRDNMAFSLRQLKMSKGEIRRRVLEVASLLDITPLLDRRPARLSGGQRQRVAMGRAIVREPKVFLMDEPLSNLDAKLRVHTRAEMSALQAQLGITTIYVTHDQAEAMTMGHRVAIMNEGRLMQCAPPQELYDIPANVFVAGFIGSPKMNILRTTMRRRADGGIEVLFGGRYLAVDVQFVRARPALRALPDGPVTIGVRPEAFAATPHGEPWNTVDVVASAVEMLGSETLIHFIGPDVEPADPGPSPFPRGQRPRNGRLRLDSNVMCARLIPPMRLHVGAALRLSVDTRRFYFFDDTGTLIN